MAVALEPVAVDALADRPEAAELLDVDVHELAGTGALVADERPAERPPQARDAVAPKHLPHGRGRQAKLRGDDQRACIRVLARGQDALLELARQSPRLVSRHRWTVAKGRPSTLLVATPQPIPGRAARTTGGRGRLWTHPLEDERDEPATRLEGETHPLWRAHSIMHLGLLGELGLGRPQGSPEARTRSGVSQVCRQQN
jgi:hypothetical protein